MTKAPDDRPSDDNQVWISAMSCSSGLQETMEDLIKWKGNPIAICPRRRSKQQSNNERCKHVRLASIHRREPDPRTFLSWADRGSRSTGTRQWLPGSRNPARPDGTRFDRMADLDSEQPWTWATVQAVRRAGNAIPDRNGGCLHHVRPPALPEAGMDRRGCFGCRTRGFGGVAGLGGSCL